MLAPFLILLIIILIKKLIRTGDAYILFSQFVTITNNLREQSPLIARKKLGTLRLEYKTKGSKSIYCNAVPQEYLSKSGDLVTDWIRVMGFNDGKWSDVTGKVAHFAGPFKNFHGNVQAPLMLSKKFQRLAFVFKDEQVINVQGNQSILSVLSANRVKPVLNKQKVN